MSDRGMTFFGSFGIGILGALILYFFRPQSDFFMLVFFGLVLGITSMCLIYLAITMLAFFLHAFKEAFLKDKPKP